MVIASCNMKTQPPSLLGRSITVVAPSPRNVNRGGRIILMSVHCSLPHRGTQIVAEESSSSGDVARRHYQFDDLALHDSWKSWQSPVEFFAENKNIAGFDNVRELVENALDSVESISELPVVEITIEEIKKSKFNSMIGLVDHERVDAALYDDYETEKARELVKKFGIDPNNAFAFWDWVGSRYNVCSVVGVLPLSLQYGFQVIEK